MPRLVFYMEGMYYQEGVDGGLGMGKQLALSRLLALMAANFSGPLPYNCVQG